MSEQELTQSLVHYDEHWVSEWKPEVTFAQMGLIFNMLNILQQTFLFSVVVVALCRPLSLHCTLLGWSSVVPPCRALVGLSLSSVVLDTAPMLPASGCVIQWRSSPAEARTACFQREVAR